MATLIAPAEYVLVGLCATGTQVRVPFIAHLAPEARRGRTVGSVMFGLLGGIMLARPRGALYRHIPVLRRRALCQALMFAAFNMFWMAVPIMFAEPLDMDRRGIALFALAAAGGALAAPIAGRFADRGYARSMTAAAKLTLGLMCYATRWAADWKWPVALVVLTVIFDAAAQANQIASQRIIFSASPETRGRVDAIYMAIYIDQLYRGRHRVGAGHHHLPFRRLVRDGYDRWAYWNHVIGDFCDGTLAGRIEPNQFLTNLSAAQWWCSKTYSSQRRKMTENRNNSKIEITKFVDANKFI